MAQIALPRQQVTQTSESSGIGSPLYERRRSSRLGSVDLLPNPDFVFPQPSTASSGSLGSARRSPSLEVISPSMSSPLSIPTKRRSVNALPDFSFDPGATLSKSAPLATPPHSPTLQTPTTPTTTKNIGHRRGGSEFIGGDVRSSSSILSSSPTKGDGMLLPSGPGLRPGPPAGRRGHAHRRSGAISFHDLSSIMQPPNGTRSGSAPVTPREPEPPVPPLPHTSHKSSSQPSLRSTALEQHPLFATEDGDSSPKRPPSRARVGFADRVEYIRPLSTISSETESSLSTIRGHSVSNSLSSIVSAGTASPQSRMGRPSLITTFEDGSGQARPKTADPIMMLNGKMRGKADLRIDLTAPKRPSSAISSPITPASSASSPGITARGTTKRRSFFRLDQKRSESNHADETKTANTAESSQPVTQPDSPLGSPTKTSIEDELDDATGKAKDKKDKTSRKPKKMKSWGNPFSSKKQKQSSSKQKAQEVPISPGEIAPPSEDLEAPDEDVFLMDPDFDVDNTVTIVTPVADDIPKPQVTTNLESFQQNRSSWQDYDMTSPVIDLDAALGPFNTPPLGHGSRQKGRGFASAKRTMHSSGFNAALATNVHRRTESAPALVPFDMRGSMTSTTAMADVFEEEEEEEEADGRHQSVSDDSNIPSAITTPDDTAVQEKVSLTVGNEDQATQGLGVRGIEHATGGAVDISNASCNSNSSDEHTPLAEIANPEMLSATQRRVQEEMLFLQPSPVDVVQDYEEPRSSSLTRSSDSTVTPRTSIEQQRKEPRPLLNLTLPLSQPALMTPDTFTSSSFSSPVFTNNQSPFDTPRLGTATSSVTDNTGGSHYLSFSETGPEYRVSVDDVPSLTSSRSTMTTGAHHYPVFGPRVPGERSCSITSLPSALSEPRRKRSSIASLSRLVGGSFGERSKLHIEQRPMSEHIEPPRATKTKKSKRLSKLIHFWKSKDSSQ